MPYWKRVAKVVLELSAFACVAALIQGAIVHFGFVTVVPFLLMALLVVVIIIALMR